LQQLVCSTSYIFLNLVKALEEAANIKPNEKQSSVPLTTNIIFNEIFSKPVFS